MIKLYNIARFFNLCILFVVNGLDFILWEDRKINSFTFDLEKKKGDVLREQQEREKRLETIAYIDYLDEMTEYPIPEPGEE